MDFDSSFFIMLVTIMAKLSKVVVHDFSRSSLFELVIMSSANWRLSSVWLVSTAVMRADTLPDAAC